MGRQTGRSVAAICGSVLLAAALAGCTYGLNMPKKSHFKQYQTNLPKGNTVTVCSAYGCQAQTDYAFTRAEINSIIGEFKSKMRSDTPAEERRAIGYAVAWIERRVGAEIGTSADRKSIDWSGAGDRTQLDCVDEATNVTSYMMIMARHGLIKYHSIESPIAKGNLIDGRWPHYGGHVKEKSSGVDWVVDSSMDLNGKLPIVMPADEWYIPG